MVLICNEMVKKDLMHNLWVGRMSMFYSEVLYYSLRPAQKWLKDRKERTLEFDDVLHYQKIIVALSETDRIMKEIDGIVIE